jgi:hypothetical protein
VRCELCRLSVLINIIFQEKEHLEQCQPLYINVISVSLPPSVLLEQYADDIIRRSPKGTGYSLPLKGKSLT